MLWYHMRVRRSEQRDGSFTESLQIYLFFNKKITWNAEEYINNL